jgi:hypothetical protein
MLKKLIALAEGGSAWIDCRYCRFLQIAVVPLPYCHME